jgi:hypothetical protein
VPKGLVPLLDILRHNGNVAFSVSSAVGTVQWASASGQRSEWCFAAQAVNATEQELKLPVGT